MEEDNLFEDIKYLIQNYETLSSSQISCIETFSEYEKMEIIKIYNQNMEMFLEYVLTVKQ